MSQAEEVRFVATISATDRRDRWAWMYETAQRAADETGCAYFEIDYDRELALFTMRGWLKKPERETW